MLKLKVSAGLSMVLAASFILAACAQATPAAPTLDANAIYTQAAATVAAGLAQTQSSQPTATLPPPTATKAATALPTPTIAQAGAATATLAPGAVTATPGGPTPVATLTKAPPQSTVADKAEWVSQSPTDKTQVTKSQKFTVTFVLKNTGKTTWTTKYMFRYYAGDKMGAPTDLNLTKEVKPNETVEITFEMTALDKAGVTNTIWVMSNADGQNFYSVFLSLEVVN